MMEFGGIRPGEIVEIKTPRKIRRMARITGMEHDEVTGKTSFAGYILGFEPQTSYDDQIGRVIYAPPATIVYWKDGSKTVVKCGPDDDYDPTIGLLLAITKKHFGNREDYKGLLRAHFPEHEQVK